MISDDHVLPAYALTNTQCGFVTEPNSSTIQDICLFYSSMGILSDDAGFLCCRRRFACGGSLDKCRFMLGVKKNPETIVCSQDVVSVIIFVFMENIHCCLEPLFQVRSHPFIDVPGYQKALGNNAQ